MRSIYWQQNIGEKVKVILFYNYCNKLAKNIGKKIIKKNLLKTNRKKCNKQLNFNYLKFLKNILINRNNLSNKFQFKTIKLLII